VHSVLDTWIGGAGRAPAQRLDAVAQRLVDFGIAANTLSHLALLSGVAAGLGFARGHAALAGLLLLVSSLLDAVDGRVARLGSGPTPWGGVIDLTYDRVVEASVLLGIIAPRPTLYWPALVLAATWYVNLCVFLAVGAASDRHSEKLIHYPPGLLERADAWIFSAVVLLVPSWAYAALYVYAALEVVTAAQRFRYGRAALKG
jgi:phosphatidylglycerophosphate synthase